MDFDKNYRQWTYQYCTEFGWFQVPNADHPMRSQLINSQYWLDYCKRVFGDSYDGPKIDDINKLYGGMNIQGSNIYFANAVEDPWQWAGMREIHDPSTQSGMKAVLIDCTNCGHCVDLGTSMATDPPAVLNARAAIFEQIKIWLNEAEMMKLSATLFLQ